MPAVIASWNTETNMPLFSLGETSEIYKGAAKVTAPTAKPQKILEAINISTFGATAQNIEPKKNITAVEIITFFRPKISARTPFSAAPKRAPIKTELTRSPCVETFRCQS